jgi:hypothetical protein
VLKSQAGKQDVDLRMPLTQNNETNRSSRPEKRARPMADRGCFIPDALSGQPNPRVWQAMTERFSSTTPRQAGASGYLT